MVKAKLPKAWFILPKIALEMHSKYDGKMYRNDFYLGFEHLMSHLKLFGWNEKTFDSLTHW